MEHESRRESGEARAARAVGPGMGAAGGRSSRLRDVVVTLGSDGVTSWACLGSPPQDGPAGAQVRGAVGSAEGDTGVTVLAGAFVAGFRFHHGMHPRVLWRMEEGDRLVPIREGGNPYDCWAVALYTQSGARIGYLPRGCNMPIAMMMDQGWPIRIAIAAVNPDAETWERVRVTVWTEQPGPGCRQSN
jgi:hypothetical protein